MNASEQREVTKAVNFAHTDPRFAAATLSGVMRATRSQKSFLQMVTAMNDAGLREHMEVVGGVFVAKVA
jgi:hypothetical protein